MRRAASLATFITLLGPAIPSLMAQELDANRNPKLRE
jgi:hypothetical protein